MTTEEMAGRIVEFVEKKGAAGATFPELHRLFGEEFEGNYELGVKGFPGLVIWQGVSQTALDALNSELVQKRVERKPVDLLIYLADGELLNMPLAQKLPKGGYKKPHWVPVGFFPKSEGSGDMGVVTAG